ncbi:MAG: TonB-dependent receptor [Pseudomonadota bacterium]|nr:TonB-dependent receptor [Pseudomonadota bacterium]
MRGFWSVAAVLGTGFAVPTLTPTLALAQTVAPSAAEAVPAAEEEAAPARDESEAVANATGNDIVVTATKREQALQNVPVAITVTTAATIELAHIRDVEDLSTLTPSLRVIDHQSSAQTIFTIRGFGNGADNVGIEPSVGVFIDGVYRSRSAAQIEDFPDVAQVEVLRGPQSTLFGKNAVAGVINILTDEPKFKAAGNAEISYGNDNAVVAKGMITGALSKNIAVSIAGSYDRRDGYVHDATTGKDINNRNRWFLRGQLLYEPNTQLKVRLIADYGRIKELCCATVNLRSSGATAALRAVGGQVNSPATPFSNVIYDNFDPTNDIRDYGVSAQVDYSLGPLTVTSITAWRKNRNITNVDADFTSADLLGRFSGDVSISTLSQELRVATNMEGSINFIAGGYYIHERISQTGQTLYGQGYRPYANLLIQGASGGALNVAALENEFGALQGHPGLYSGQFFGAGQGLAEAYALHDDAISVFAQVDFKPIKRVTLTAGIDYTHDGKYFSTNVHSSDVFSGINLNAIGALAVRAGAPQAVAAQLLALKALQIFPPFLNVPNAVESGRTEDGDISWTARANFDATDRIKLYADVSTGFKASSINLSRDSRPALSDAAAIAAAGLGQVNQSYGTRFAGPEHSMLFEGGMKAHWGIATLNLAIFRQSIKGFQSNLFNGTGFVLLNAQKESVNGFEFEGVINPVAELTLSQSLTYLRPKYDQFSNSSFGDISGSTPAGIPPLSFTAAATWDHPFANGDHGILRGDWHYESQTQIADGLPSEITVNPVSGAVDYQAAIDAARAFKRTVSEFDGSLTYHLHSGLEVSVWGRNLTDDRYITVIFNSPAQPGSVSGYPNQPRTYGVSALYKF